MKTPVIIKKTHEQKKYSLIIICSVFPFHIHNFMFQFDFIWTLFLYISLTRLVKPILIKVFDELNKSR